MKMKSERITPQISNASNLRPWKLFFIFDQASDLFKVDMKLLQNENMINENKGQRLFGGSAVEDFPNF
jgi:hypothetical protein